jgi:triosephosphate isomerase
MAQVIILINLKTYREGLGQGAHRIANAAEEVAAESGALIGVCPQLVDLHPLARHFEVPVYAQHVDGVAPGASTGHVTADAIRLAGARGSLINHSERRLTLAEIEASVRACEQHGLNSVVCTNNVPTSAAAAAIRPFCVAIEPPELIGSGISVAKADPGIIRGSVEAIRAVNPDVKILTGAGIQSGDCVRIATELGTDGVLLASSVVKANDPATVLRDLVSQL